MPTEAIVSHLSSFYLEILKVHLKGETMEGIDLTDLARRTNNFSGSDLKNLAVSAALASLKDIIPDMWNSKKTLKAKGKDSTNDAKEDDEKKEDAEDDEDSDSDSDDDDTPEIAPRILRPIHFKAAFEQVSATCSRDMASVQKLRNWAAQFSRDSGAGLGATPAASTSPLANGHAHPGAPTATTTTTATGTGAGGATTTGATPSYRGLAAGGEGGGLWDHRYESNMLSRFSNLPRPGAGSGGAGGSGAGGSGSGAGAGTGGSSTGRGSGSGSGA